MAFESPKELVEAPVRCARVERRSIRPLLQLGLGGAVPVVGERAKEQIVDSLAEQCEADRITTSRRSSA